MGLFGHMCIHNSGIHRNVVSTGTPCTPSNSTILTATPTFTTANNPPAPSDFSCPHCARNFASRIGPDGHLRIHRTRTGEPVSGNPTYSHRPSFYCSRTFPHRMNLLGYMCLHDNVW
ncbi:unnamed protein product [Schistocephalus solidus]|uniref:C2H2-type domain-containing protein n=1 Tax=Schistocephalus solidus TaxID=70667 RepID=A0A183SY18_SCHSO|nr:unnamed protein product [Schistocephalus solidus]